MNPFGSVGSLRSGGNINGFRLAFALQLVTPVSTAQAAASSTETTSDAAPAAAPAEPAGTTPDESLALPPVPTDKMSTKVPEPSWDTGLHLGVCGVGSERLWAVTKFCLGGLVDVMFFRQKEDETGLGGYLGLSSAGFRDVRLSGGITSVVSLIDWFSLSLRGGGLSVMRSEGVQAGLEGYLGVGHRSISLSSHYALSHSLFSGVQYALPSGSLPASHTIWLGLQIDGVWFTAPRGLFR